MNRRKLCKPLQDEQAALLTPSERKFLEEVRDAIDRKLGSAENCYFLGGAENDLEVESEILALEENVSFIVKHLKEGELARQNFAKTYPEWKENRERCINQLLEIAKSINSDRFKCNVSKLVGYGTSAVGDGIALASAILMPPTLGLTIPLAIGGTSLAVGTSITETALLKSKVNKAKALIERDEKYFRGMSDWLNHASDLQEAISKVLHFDNVKDIPQQIKKFVDDGMHINNEIKRKLYIDEGIGEIIKSISIFLPSKISVVDIANVISTLVTVFLLMINTKNRLIFDCASLTIKIVLNFGSVNLFRRSKMPFAKKSATAVTRGAAAAVGIVLDVIGIALTSIDIHKGSLSPEAEIIAEAASNLREEANVLEEVYKHLSPEKQCGSVF